jgi:hypothetical protein
VARLAGWWAPAPATFSLIRDRDGTARAFFVRLDSETILPLRRDGDPVVATSRRHLRDHPLPRGQLALGLRRWLDVDHGEAPGPVPAACWLDTKRTYAALRPALRRMYVAVEDAAAHLPVVERLGFRPLPAPLGPRGRVEAGSPRPRCSTAAPTRAWSSTSGRDPSTAGWPAPLEFGELSPLDAAAGGP